MFIYLQMIESDEDKSKFEQIYMQYRNLMFCVAQRILHNQQDAEDAVHQAFLAILLNLKKISRVKCPETRSYIVIITENKAIDIIRARERFATSDFDEGVDGISIPPPGDGGLADALARLPAKYREVILLRYDNGYSTKELAKMLNMTQGAVQKLIWRAKQALGRELEKEGDSQ